MNIWNDITLPSIAIGRYEKLEHILISVYNHTLRPK